MIVTFSAVGRMKAGPERELFDRYVGRAEALGRSLGITDIRLHEKRESGAQTKQARRTDEAEALLKPFQANDCLIVFDERGKAVSSEAFATIIDGTRTMSRDAGLIIGGPDGLDDRIRARAGHVVSFGAMTMPHQLARILAAEQLYRAFTLLSGHPYHRA